jgi:hypothetical protein
MRKFAVLLACLLGLALGIGSVQHALGAILGVPSSNGVVTACASNSDGALRAVASATSCSGTESVLSWQTRSFRLGPANITDGQTRVLLNNKYSLSLTLTCSVDSMVTGDVRAAISAKTASTSAVLGGVLFFQDPTYTSGNENIRSVQQALTTTSTDVQYLQARGTLGNATVATTDTTFVYTNNANSATMSVVIHITADGSGHCTASGVATPT